MWKSSVRICIGVGVILGAMLYYLSLTKSNNCEHHAKVNQRFNEMLVLARVEIPQYLADNPDISQKEFTEYAEKIRKERNFFIDDNLTQWKNPDNESDAVAIRDCSAINSGYYRFNGTRSR